MSLKRDEVRFTLHCEPECEPIAGNALASNDKEENRAYEDEILAKLNAGDEWAWCVVVVTASHPYLPFVGRDSLGCCSYDDEADFRKSDYFEDMKAAALADMENRYNAVLAHEASTNEGGGMRKALHRLISAAANRENTMGDPITLLEVQAELRAATVEARAALLVPDPRDVL